MTSERAYPYFTEEHDLFRESIRKFCREEVARRRRPLRLNLADACLHVRGQLQAVHLVQQRAVQRRAGLFAGSQGAAIEDRVEVWAV